MAITKIIGPIHRPAKGSKYRILKNTVNYIVNPEKTEDGRWVGTLNCVSGYVVEQMIENFKYFGKEPKSTKNRIGYHFTLSWPENSDISPETAFKITEEFCYQLLEEYQAVYAVHTDKKHIHSHICFSAVSLEGKKYRYEKDDWEKKLQPVTDRLCEKYGLPTLAMDLDMDDQEREERRKENAIRWKNRRQYYVHMSEEEKVQKRRSNGNYYNEKEIAYSIGDHIRCDIDDAIYRSTNFSDFVTIMRSKGYEIKRGKYFAVRTRDMQRFRRVYKLGFGYSEQDIKNRIAIREQPLPEFVDEDRTDAVNLEKHTRRRIELTTESRRHYAMQYQAGLLKPGQNRSYKVIRESLKNIEESQALDEIKEKYYILDAEDVIRTERKLKQEAEFLERKKKEIADTIRPYRKLLNAHRKAEKCKDGYKFYQESGDLIFKSEADVYQEYLDMLKIFQLQEKDLETLQQNYRNRRNDTNTEIRQIKKQIKILESYIGESHNKKISREEKKQESEKKYIQAKGKIER